MLVLACRHRPTWSRLLHMRLSLSLAHPLLMSLLVLCLRQVRMPLTLWPRALEDQGVAPRPTSEGKNQPCYTQ